MERLLFTKMSGAGNDFILLDKKLNPLLELDSFKISSMCDRRNGIGADGLLLIEDDNKFDFRMNYYNADGSSGVLCGNGARCAIYYSKLSSRAKSETVKFVSNTGLYSGEILGDGLIKFILNDPKNLQLNFQIEIDDKIVKGSSINTGSPHTVINVQDILDRSANCIYPGIYEVPVYELGKEIRHHAFFGNEGTNVNFIQVEGDKIKIRTFERGVENETHACGTGSVAAAIISNINKDVIPPVSLITRSGAELIVNFERFGDTFKNVSLTGPAKVVFTGEITI